MALDNFDFRRELQQLINRHSVDTALSTPDFLLADYLVEHLATLAKLQGARDKWFTGTSAIRPER